ncbi:DUF3450 domain-containing protein [Pleionea sp. CnH1-48]|uniref:DUF3450 domain-containing protein n=1 Tax=Pleionea sp. CnH1-48 TaxID=2954494 RepID=UPI00209727A9|nr:DUF3450 domain-containing protein [Pleionea sp. CnH1-48]MCO7225442.1 DUF3450 domain-containing protein [Pleionea sp. CnH1-48]
MLYKNSISRIIALCAATALFCSTGATFASGKLEPSIKVEKRIGKSAASNQKRIDRLAEQTLDLNLDYKHKLSQIEQYKIYNHSLEVSIKSQEEEMASLQQQMNTIDDTERGLIPLMEEMIATLEQFIELDMPFLKQKRVDRVARLRNSMLRADTSVSEKYRRIMEAYQIELDYGNSVQAYEETMDVDGVEKQVDVLRFGRTALMFITRGDNPVAKAWDINSKSWKTLDSAQTTAVARAYKDVKRNNKKLIVIPVSAPERA